MANITIKNELATLIVAINDNEYCIPKSLCYKVIKNNSMFLITPSYDVREKIYSTIKITPSVDNVIYLPDNTVISDINELDELITRILYEHEMQHYNSQDVESFCVIGYNTKIKINSIYGINTGGSDLYMQVHSLTEPYSILSVEDDGSGKCKIKLSSSGVNTGDEVYIKTTGDKNGIDGKQTVTNTSGEYIYINKIFVENDTGNLSVISDGITAQKTYPVAAGDDRFVTWTGGYKYDYGVYICGSSTILQKNETGNFIFEIVYELV